MIRKLDLTRKVADKNTKVTYTGYFLLSHIDYQPLNDDIIGLVKNMTATRRVKRSPQKLSNKLNLTVAQCIDRFGPNFEKYIPESDSENTYDDYNKNYISTLVGMYQDWNIERLNTHIAILTHYTGRNRSFNQQYYIKNLIDNVFMPKYVLNGGVIINSESNPDVYWLFLVNNNNMSLTEVVKPAIPQTPFVSCKTCGYIFQISALLQVNVQTLLKFMQDATHNCYCDVFEYQKDCVGEKK